MIAEEIILDLEPALAHLRDANATLSPALLATFSNLKKTDLAAFAKTWVTLPAERKSRVARLFAEMSEENARLDFTPIFRNVLNDADARVRTAAIEGLWEDQDPALAKILIGFLRNDPEAGVRASAAESLGRYVLLGEYDRITPALAERVRNALVVTFRNSSEPVEVRAPALESLGYASRADIPAMLSEAYGSADAAMQTSAIAGMGRSADSKWCSIITGELDSPDPRMRFQAVHALGELECREPVRRVVAMLDDPDRQVQIAAIAALGHIGGKPAKDALTRLIQLEDEVLSELAQDALEELTFSEDDLPLIAVGEPRAELDDELFDEDELDESDSSDDEAPDR